MIRKFCRLTLVPDSAWVAQAGQASRSRTASLDHFPEVEFEPGMLYVTTRAISSRVNANYDGWPAEELRKAYRTFIGRGVFVDHNNWDAERSRGVILDAKLYEDKLSSGHDDVWVELLIEVDASAFPKLAEAIMSNDIDAVSMGADVEFTICSICGNKAHEVREYCGHIPAMKGRKLAVEDKVAGRSIQKLCFEDCYGVNFFEISFVFDPADESALISDKMLYTGRASRRTQRHLRLVGESLPRYRHRVSSISKAASRNVADRVVMNIPEAVNTLRADQECPNCGAPFDGLSCKSCGFEQAAPGLGDPNTGVGQQSETDETKPPAEKGPPNSPTQKPPAKKPPAKDQKSKTPDKQKPSDKKKGGHMSRFEELAQRRQADLPVSYEQQSAPANNVPEYGQGAGAEGQATPPPEPAVQPAPELRAQQDQVDPRTLDTSEVQGPPGQSEVTETGQAVQAPKQVQPPVARRNASREDLLAQARRHIEAAETLARIAEEITPDNVQQLGGPPPGVDFGADGQLDVEAPTDEQNQLQRADRPETVNDGSETGVTPSENQQTTNQFQDDVGSEPYRGSSKDGHRVLGIANFVDERIKLRLTPPNERMAEIGRFEQLSDRELQGWFKATEEFKAARVRTASNEPRRVRTASRAQRLPSFGEEKQASSEGGEVDEQGLTYLAFL